MNKQALKKALKQAALPVTVRADETSEGKPLAEPQVVLLQTPSDVRSFLDHVNTKLDWYLK